MKNRLQIITSMCYTWRHDYGLRRGSCEDYEKPFQTGLTDEEAMALWNQMAQVFDNSIAPYMDFKNE